MASNHSQATTAIDRQILKKNVVAYQVPDKLDLTTKFDAITK